MSRYRLGVKSLRCGVANSEEPLVRFQLPTVHTIIARFFLLFFSFFFPSAISHSIIAPPRYVLEKSRQLT
jgi:hypothetical protein